MDATRIRIQEEKREKIQEERKIRMEERQKKNEQWNLEN